MPVLSVKLLPLEFGENYLKNVNNHSYRGSFKCYNISVIIVKSLNF